MMRLGTTSDKDAHQTRCVPANARAQISVAAVRPPHGSEWKARPAAGRISRRGGAFAHLSVA